MDAKDRIEDFAIGMASALRKAKKELRFAGTDEVRKAAAQKEIDESRKSFKQAIRMYSEAWK